MTTNVVGADDDDDPLTRLINLDGGKEDYRMSKESLKGSEEVESKSESERNLREICVEQK